MWSHAESAISIAPHIHTITFSYWPITFSTTPSSILLLGRACARAPNLKRLEIINMQAQMEGIANLGFLRNGLVVDDVIRFVHVVKFTSCDKNSTSFLFKVFRFPELKEIHWDGNVEVVNGEPKIAFHINLPCCRWNTEVEDGKST